MNGRKKSTQPGGPKTKTCSPAISKEVSKKLLGCLGTYCGFVMGLKNPPQNHGFGGGFSALFDICSFIVLRRYLTTKSQTNGFYDFNHLVLKIWTKFFVQNVFFYHRVQNSTTGKSRISFSLPKPSSVLLKVLLGPVKI